MGYRTQRSGMKKLNEYRSSGYPVEASNRRKQRLRYYFVLARLTKKPTTAKKPIEAI